MTFEDMLKASFISQVSYEPYRKRMSDERMWDNLWAKPYFKYFYEDDPEEDSGWKTANPQFGKAARYFYLQEHPFEVAFKVSEKEKSPGECLMLFEDAMGFKNSDGV